MTCCWEDFNKLISTTSGQERIKQEYVTTFHRPVVGHCENSLRDMYLFLRSKNEQKEIDMAQRLIVKKGSEILYIAGSRTDITQWSQKQIHDYLILFPKASEYFEVVEEESTKSTKKQSE